MRQVSGVRVSLGERAVYVEQRGTGNDWVVFEAGAGCGRTCWDPVTSLLADSARLVSYDRFGRALSGRAPSELSIDQMAEDLVAMTEKVVPDQFVLVAHSMGGLVARRAAEQLGSRLRGLLLIDILPEKSPVYDDWDKTTRQVQRTLALTQQLTRFRPLARAVSANVRRLYPADTYQTMLTEDFTPAGTAQTRREVSAVAAAVHQFRAQPPELPHCPTIVVSPTEAAKGREKNVALNCEHQRRYADSLPDGRYETVQSAHLIQAEQPEIIATRIRSLLEQKEPV